MKKIYVFTLPTCAPCKVLKNQLEANLEWFKDQGFPEIEFLDMSETNDHTLELATLFSVRSAPSVYVRFDQGNNVVGPLKSLSEIQETVLKTDNGDTSYA